MSGKILEEESKMVIIENQEGAGNQKIPEHQAKPEKQNGDSSQIIQETEPRTPHGKYKLPKGLLSVTGPQIEVIHIKPLYFNSSVYEEGKRHKKSRGNDLILPFTDSIHKVLFCHSSLQSVPNLEKAFFQHQAQGVINRKMQLLNLKCLRLRHDDRNIGLSLQRSAVFSSESDGLHAQGLCNGHGIHHVLRITGGRNTDQHIARPSVSVRLLGEDQIPVHVIQIGGRKSCVAG